MSIDTGEREPIGRQMFHHHLHQFSEPSSDCLLPSECRPSGDLCRNHAGDAQMQALLVCCASAGHRLSSDDIFCNQIPKFLAGLSKQAISLAREAPNLHDKPQPILQR